MPTPVEIPIIRTERLVLRPAGPADAAAMATFLAANGDHLDRWSPVPPPGYLTEAYWARKLEAEAQDLAADRAARFLLAEARDPDGIVGWANFSTIVRGVWHCANLGYGLGAAHEGKGYMVEGLRGAIAHMFGPRNLHRIQANHMPANLRSAKVLATLGFKVEGYAFAYLRINGRWEDHVLTSLTNPAWQEPPA